MLAIRVSRPIHDLYDFIQKLNDKCEKYIVYEHTDASRPHIHGLLVNCEVSTDTLKNYIKSALKVTTFPKTDWSFVSKDVNVKFITYMSKGKLEPKALKGFTPDEVDALKREWVEQPAKSKVQTRLTYVVKETQNERKQRQSDMVDEIVDTITKDGIKSPREIIQVIWRVVVVKNKNVTGRYKLRDYYDAVVSRTNHTEWLYEMETFVRFKN